MSCYVVLLTNVQIDIASEIKAGEINCGGKVWFVEAPDELHLKLRGLNLKSQFSYLISSENRLAYDLDLSYPQFNQNFSMQYLHAQSKSFFKLIARYICSSSAKLILLDFSHEAKIIARKSLNVSQIDDRRFELKKNILYTIKT